MKIGIYGGSFNPVHNAHIAVVEKVLEKNLVDEIWLMPCKYHAFNKDLASAEDRLNMLELVFNDVERVKIDRTEINMNKISYTAQTIKILREKYDHEFSFIVGIDALNDIDKWQEADYLKKSLNFILIQRKGYELNTIDLKLRDIIDETLHLSSTEVRRRIRENRSISGLVDKKVEEYIFEKKLYLDKEYKNPASTVDLIVPYKAGYIFIMRKYAPFKDEWALPGGFLEYGKETLEEAAVRELYEETSLRTTTDKLKLVGVYSNPERDPRGHVISHVYEVLKVTGKPKANDDAKEIAIFRDKPNDLAFDHSKIMQDYYSQIVRENSKGKNG